MTGVAGAGAATPSQRESAGPPSSEGETGGGGEHPPPPTQESQSTGIRIDDVQLNFVTREGSDLRPVIFVKWTNLTQQPVTGIFGTVRIFDQDGKQIAEVPRETIYRGPAIRPDESHEDDRDRDGIVIRIRLPGTPSSAHVIVERVE